MKTFLAVPTQSSLRLVSARFTAKMMSNGHLPAAALALLFIASAVQLSAGRPSEAPPPAKQIPLWRKYLRNDTVTGRVVPCSAEEKFCLQRGLLLHEPSGKCFLWGKNAPVCKELGEVFRVDKEAFASTGHVRGACVSRDLCDDSTEYKMAADGSCRYMAEVSEICYGQTGLGTSEDLFGETECACSFDPCPVSEEKFDPPSDKLSEGECVVPDLRVTELPTHAWDSLLSTTRSQVPCTETERRCFLDGRLYHEPRDLCFRVWRQGPCEEGQWFVLDREEAVNGSGRVQGKCEALPCGAERVKSSVDGSCVTARELCGGAYAVTYDAAGIAACSFWLAASASSYDNLRLPTERAEDGLCRFPGLGIAPQGPAGEPHLPPPAPPRACPDSKTGYCGRNVTAPVAPHA